MLTLECPLPTVQTIERHQPTIQTFPGWLDKYLVEQRLLPPRDAGAIVENMFFTNFFVTRVAWWTHADVQVRVRLFCCCAPALPNIPQSATVLLGHRFRFSIYGVPGASSDAICFVVSAFLESR